MPDDLPGQAEFPVMQPRRGRPPNPHGQLRKVFTLRGTLAWETWLGAYADAAKSDRAELVERALRELARLDGFEPPPPRL